MNTKLNILAIGVGSNVTVGILKAIRNSNIGNYKLIGACVSDYASGYHFCDEVLLCPLSRSSTFIQWLSDVVVNLNINVILSGVEEVLDVLSDFGGQFGGAKVLVASPSNIRTFNDKMKTFEWFVKNKLRHPITIDLNSINAIENVVQKIGFPCVIKPKIGKGSVGVRVIRTSDELAGLRGGDQLLAQELVGSESSEYTCGVYKSLFNYVEVIVMKRKLRGGSTSVAEVIDDKCIVDYCKEIAERIDTFGSFNIQLRYCHERNLPICFEVNMRQSGTTAIRHQFGFRDCEVWIMESVYHKSFQDLFSIVPGVAVRYEEEVFFRREELEKLNLDTPVSLSASLI